MRCYLQGGFMIQFSKRILIPFLSISLTSISSFAKGPCEWEKFVYEPKFQEARFVANSETYSPYTTNMRVVTKSLGKMYVPETIDTEEACVWNAITQSPKNATDYIKWSFDGKPMGEVDHMSTYYIRHMPANQDAIIEGTILALHQVCLLYFADRSNKPSMTPIRNIMVGYQYTPRKKSEYKTEPFDIGYREKVPVENSSESFSSSPSSVKIDEPEYDVTDVYATYGKINFIPNVVIGQTNEDTEKACSDLADQTLKKYYAYNQPKEYTKIHWEVEHPFAINSRGWIIPNQQMLNTSETKIKDTQPAEVQKSKKVDVTY